MKFFFFKRSTLSPRRDGAVFILNTKRSVRCAFVRCFYIFSFALTAAVLVFQSHAVFVHAYQITTKTTTTAPRPSVAEQSTDHHGFKIMSHAKNVSSYDLTATAEINLQIQFFLSFRRSTADLFQIHYDVRVFNYYTAI